MPGDHISFSAGDQLRAANGLYMPEPHQLQRYGAAVDDSTSGSELGSIAAAAPQGRHVGATTSFGLLPGCVG